MSAILSAAAAIVETIREAIPELKAVRTYHAPIDGEEIARELQMLPGALLVFTGGSPKWVGGSLGIQARWTLCVVTEGMDPQKRTALAVALSEKAFRLIAASDFSGSVMRTPEEMQMRTLYTGQIDERAISIVTISWAQDIELIEPPDQGDLNDFLGIRVDFTLPTSTETSDA